MLYQQFIRVSEIDTTIAHLHETLAGLYAERAELLQGVAHQAAASPVPAVPPLTLAARPNYERLAALWQCHGIKLPAYRVVAKKLERACNIINQLAAENPQLQGNIQLIAVPPYAMLKKVVDSLEGRQENLFVFADDAVSGKVKKTRNWSFVVVIGREFSVPVDNVQTLLKGDELNYKEYDCTGLGVQELIAAELQGVKTVGEDGWTLLLKDSLPGYVPCAKRLQDRIIFDIDDADGLLDNNFLQPAIQAA